jgi:GNAT superfamily N-acetyltransferase
LVACVHIGEQAETGLYAPLGGGEGRLDLKPDVAVRIAEPRDSARIAELLEQLGYPMHPAVIQEKLSSLAEGPIDRILVAEIGGQVVGVTSFHITPLLHEEREAGRVTALVVDREFRGHGIGTLLLYAAEEWAWSCGCTRVEVTSGDHRPDAHRFYESRGYRCDERRFLKPNPERSGRKEFQG